MHYAVQMQLTCATIQADKHEFILYISKGYIPDGAPSYQHYDLQELQAYFATAHHNVLFALDKQNGRHYMMLVFSSKNLVQAFYQRSFQMIHILSIIDPNYALGLQVHADIHAGFV